MAIMSVVSNNARPSLTGTGKTGKGKRKGAGKGKRKGAGKGKRKGATKKKPAKKGRK